MRRTMLRLLVLPALIGLAPLAATSPAAARAGCDSYGRCFDFAGPSDRLAGGEALWQRADAGDAATEPGDPMALAHGTLGDPLQALADDD